MMLSLPREPALLLQSQIGVDVHLRGFHGLMSEPEPDDRLINAILEQFHSRTVAPLPVTAHA
jgi:hypothetical protein